MYINETANISEKEENLQGFFILFFCLIHFTFYSIIETLKNQSGMSYQFCDLAYLSCTSPMVFHLSDNDPLFVSVIAIGPIFFLATFPFSFTLHLLNDSRLTSSENNCEQLD